jgi:hypothetical protein
MSSTSKVIFVLLLSSLSVLSGCSHKPQSKTISATSDASGNHAGTADISGPATVTCVSATDDTGTVTPPTCVIAAPGTNGVVKIGEKIVVASAGTVALNCQGKGTLTCTARIEE